MFTKLGEVLNSYYVYRSYQNSFIPGFTAGYMTKGVIEATDILGNDCFITPESNSFGNDFFASTSSSAGIAVGSGDTPVTGEETELDEMITTLTGTSSVTNFYDETNLVYGNRVELTLSNSTENDIVIKEVGKIVSNKTSSTHGGSVTSTTKSFLVLREVLDEPVTIPAGEAGIVRLEFIFPNSIANE